MNYKVDVLEVISEQYKACEDELLWCRARIKDKDKMLGISTVRTLRRNMRNVKKLLGNIHDNLKIIEKDIYNKRTATDVAEIKE